MFSFWRLSTIAAVLLAYSPVGAFASPVAAPEDKPHTGFESVHRTPIDIMTNSLIDSKPGSSRSFSYARSPAEISRSATPSNDALMVEPGNFHQPIVETSVGSIPPAAAPLMEPAMSAGPAQVTPSGAIRREFSPTAVNAPEPGSLGLLALSSLYLLRRRQRRMPVAE